MTSNDHCSKALKGFVTETAPLQYASRHISGLRNA